MNEGGFMTALIVIACIVLFFAFILSLRATITVSYSDTIRLYVRVLFLKINILPKKNKKGPFSMSSKQAQKIKDNLEKKKQKKLLKKQKKQADKEKDKEGKKKSLSEILDMLGLVKSIIGAVTKKFFGHLNVRVSKLNITVATGDAATTAIAYGAVYEAASAIFAILEPLDNVSLPKRKNVSITTDYLSDKMQADVKISFALRAWHLFDLAFAALIKFIKHKFKSN